MCRTVIVSFLLFPCLLLYHLRSYLKLEIVGRGWGISYRGLLEFQKYKKGFLLYRINFMAIRRASFSHSFHHHLLLLHLCTMCKKTRPMYGFQIFLLPNERYRFLFHLARFANGNKRMERTKLGNCYGYGFYPLPCVEYIVDEADGEFPHFLSAQRKQTKSKTTTTKKPLKKRKGADGIHPIDILRIC